MGFRVLSVLWLLLFCAFAEAQLVNGTPQFQGHAPVGPVSLDGTMGYEEFPAVDQTAGYSDPVIKLTIDGFFYSRTGSGGDALVIEDAPFPPGGNPILTAEEIDFNSEWGGNVDLMLGDVMHLNYLWTGRARTDIARSGTPEADVSFFGGHAADESETYVARYDSRLALGSIGLGNTRTPFFSVHGGLAFGELNESFDLLSSFSPITGFFSEAENHLYGAQLGGVAQIWSNGLSKVECAFSGGVYYNDMEVNAQALGIEATWNDEDVAFSGSANVALVIPAYPFNFRIGYQATYLTGVALLPETSQTLDLFDGSGDITTGDTIYHGLLLGVEFLR